MLLQLEAHRCDSECMSSESLVLSGTHVRLEPLEPRHAAGLAAAAAGDPSLYRWSPVPQGSHEAEKYIDTALAWQAAGTAVPFATVRRFLQHPAANNRCRDRGVMSSAMATSRYATVTSRNLLQAIN